VFVARPAQLVAPNARERTWQRVDQGSSFPSYQKGGPEVARRLGRFDLRRLYPELDPTIHEAFSWRPKNETGDNSSPQAASLTCGLNLNLTGAFLLRGDGIGSVSITA
jgi:hypothetical protein